MTMKTSLDLRCALATALLCTLGMVQVCPAQTLPAPPVSADPVQAYEYDARGNLTKRTQAPATQKLQTRSAIDALGRTRSVTDARAGITQFGYDGAGRTVRVSDPRQLLTQTPRNGLGDAGQLLSPDTGTASMSYDAAGNLKGVTDSRGVVRGYTYDALNRLNAASYSQSGQTTVVHQWVYDRTDVPNGIGRLGNVLFPDGSLGITYDAEGRVLSQRQQVSAAAGANSAALTHSASYGYDLDGHLTSIVYPSGRTLSIGYSAGQVSSIGLAKDSASTATPLISGIQWQPFGGVKTWQWQMASGPEASDRVYDGSGRLVRYRLGGSVRDLSYDAADRIAGYKHYDAATAAAQPTLDQAFQYDDLGRLTQVTLYAGSWSFAYDANGNRSSATLNGNTSGYTTASSSNRLMGLTNPARSISYDNAGNATADGLFSASYDLTGMLRTLSKAGMTSTYTYDALGRRIRKVSSTGAASTIVFFYDQGGHVLGEYDSTGNAVREYVWIADTPVAVFTPDATNAANPPLVYFIHTDHLNTPRVVVDKANKVRWRWLAEPFGSAAAETDPSGLGAFAFNLRFPGQYFDQESGLFYNMARYYDPTEGRYVQSDPIGLNGGINTYAYTFNQPTKYTDPTGEFVPLVVYVVVETAPVWAPYVAYGTAALATAAATYLTLSPPGTVTPPPTPPTSQATESQKCRNLRETIENLRREVYDKRIPDLASNSTRPNPLPYRIGPGEKLRDTVRGHEKLLNRQWRRLNELEDEYDRECKPCP